MFNRQRPITEFQLLKEYYKKCYILKTYRLLRKLFSDFHGLTLPEIVSLLVMQLFFVEILKRKLHM